MSKKRIYTAVLIGTGRIGFSLGFDRKREQPASHTMALIADRRIRIIAGCDTDNNRLNDWHHYVGKAAVFTNAADLFAAEKPDIVVIAANESAHLELALAAIHAHPRLIILEKPVALTVKDGCRIADEAKKFNVPVMVNHERRFAADYMLAKKYMARIGGIQSVTAELCSSLRVYSPDDEATGEYSLIHDGTHLVDSVQFLLQGVEEEYCNCVNHQLSSPRLLNVTYDTEKPSIVRNIAVQFTSAQCSDITVRISGRSCYFCFEIDVYGTKGRIRIGNGLAEFYSYAPSKLYSGFYSLVPDKHMTVPKKTHYFSNMIQNAVAFLDGEEVLKSTLRDGLNDLIVLEQICDMLKEQKKTQGDCRRTVTGV